MKISCYLGLAFLTFNIISRVTAWFIDNKQLKNNQNELNSTSDNDYKLYQYNDDDVRSRNERETDFYEEEDNGNYDNSNDMYPSLNLFSWWSSKNRGTLAKGGLGNETFHNNSLESNTDWRNLNGSVLNISSIPLEMQTVPCMNSSVFPRNSAYLSTKDWRLFRLNNSSKSTVNNQFLNEKKNGTKYNIIMPAFHYPFIGITTENITPNPKLMQYSNHSTESFEDQGKKKSVQSEIYTTFSPNVFYQPLNLSPPILNTPTNLLDNCNKMPNTSQNYATFLSATLKPTFKLFTMKDTTTESKKDANIFQQDFSGQPAKNVSSVYNTLLNNDFSKLIKYSKSVRQSPVVNKKPGRPLLAPMKSFLKNREKSFHFHKRTTIPFPFSIFKNQYTSNLTTKSVAFIPTSLNEVLPDTMQFGNSTLNRVFASTNSAREDLLSFLQPIPTLQFDSYNVTQKYLDRNIGNIIKSGTTENCIKLNNIQNVPRMNINYKHPNNNTIYSSNNRTDMKFVIPEYFSGLDEEVIIADQNLRKKRTSIDTPEKTVRKNTSASCGKQVPDIISDSFISKFKNLQKDLADLQRAIVSQAKACTTENPLCVKNDKRNMTVHVRVIVDVYNDTGHEDHCRTIIKEQIKAKSKKSTLNHSLSKRSWFFHPSHKLENQPQVLADEMLNNQNKLDDLTQDVIEMQNDEIGKNENSELKVLLNFPRAKLKDDKLTLNPSIVEKKPCSPIILDTSHLNPIGNEIDNPLYKAIYSKYIAGQKYLVIPLIYLEEQDRSNIYNILQPDSVYFKNLNDDSNNQPSDFIVKLLTKNRSETIKKSFRDKSESVHLDRFPNKPVKYISSSLKKFKLLNDKGSETNLYIGDPEMVYEFMFTPGNKQNMEQDKIIFEGIKLVNDNNKIDSGFNIEDQDSYEVGTKKNNTRIKCVKYPVYNLENYYNLLKRKKFDNIIVKNVRYSDKNQNIDPFLSFTSLNNDNIFATEASLSSSLNSKSNILPLITIYNSSELKREGKSNISANLNTSKLNLSNEQDLLDRLYWEKLVNDDQNHLYCPKENITSSDLQSSLLFAYKLDKKRDTNQTFRNTQLKKCCRKRAKRKTGRNGLKKNKKIGKTKNAKNKNKFFSNENTFENFSSISNLLPKLSKMNDKKFYVNHFFKIENPKENDNWLSTTVTSVAKNGRVLLVQNPIKVLGHGIQAVIVSNALRFLNASNIPPSMVALSTGSNIKLRSENRDIIKTRNGNGNSIKTSFYTIKTPTKSAKITTKNRLSSITSSLSTNKSISQCTTSSRKIESYIDSCDICGECEKICTGIPPTIVGRYIPPTCMTTKVKGTVKTQPTVTPSEEEIQRACTECEVGTKASHYRQKSSIKPRGVQCHHHIKNHTTLEHHKMKNYTICKNFSTTTTKRHISSNKYNTTKKNNTTNYNYTKKYHKARIKTGKKHYHLL